MNDIQRRHDARDARFFSGAHVSAGMRDEVRDAEDLAAIEFLDEQLDALAPEFVVRRCEVDEVTVVTDRLRELLICSDLDVDPWQYEPFDWLSPAGLRLH